MAKTNQNDVRYLEPEEFGRWDDFVNSSPAGTFFHTSQWMRVPAKWQNLVLKIAVAYKGNEWMGGMAYTCKKKFGVIPVMQMPVKTPFFSPVPGPSEAKYISRTESQQHSILNTLIDFIMKDVQHLHAQFPPSFNDIRPFTRNGFGSSVHYTYLSHLDDSELLSLFDPAVRRQIKKAEQVEYTFSRDSSPDRFGEAWELEQQSFERQNLKFRYAARDRFIEELDLLSKKGAAQSYVIRQDNRTVASQIVILDRAKRTAYYWLAGVDENFLSTGLNQLLLYLVLKDLGNKGCDQFDFVGADTESIARYKSTFNFPLVPLYSVSKSTGLARFGMMIKGLIN